MPRDINDVYTLPAGNPVIPGTVIDTDWANSTLNDIAQALTDSLDKSDPAQARNTLNLGTAATKDVGSLPSQLPAVSNLRPINGQLLVGSGIVLGSPYCTAGGTANAITLSVNGATESISPYVAGAQYRARISTTNTGSVTVSVAGGASKTCVTVTGVALPAGYIRTGVDTEFTYDATNDRFVVGREVEYGSNANGEFWRYADGRLDCIGIDLAYGPVTTAFAGGYRGANVIYTLPATYISRPSPSASADTSTLWAGCRASPNLITVNVNYWSSSAGPFNISFTVKGRWY